MPPCQSERTQQCNRNWGNRNAESKKQDDSETFQNKYEKGCATK